MSRLPEKLRALILSLKHGWVRKIGLRLFPWLLRAANHRPLVNRPGFATRRLTLELLEDRVAPAALTSTLQQAFLDGLQSLEQWGARIEQSDQLLRSVSLLNFTSSTSSTSLGEVFDPSALLHARLTQPAQQYLSTAGSGATIEGLAAALSASNLSTTDTFLLHLPVNFSSNNSFRLNGAQVFAGSGLSFDSTQSVPVTVGATLTATLDVGLSLQEGIAASDAFFIRGGALQLSASVATSSLNFNVSDGFLNTHVQNGQLQFVTNLISNLRNPDNDADGNITATELTGASVTNLIDMQDATGSFSASLPLTPVATSDNVNRFQLSGVTLAVNQGDPFGNTNPQIAFSGTGTSDLQNIAGFSATRALQVLDNIGAWLDQARASSFFQKNLPFAQDQHFGDAVRFQELLTARLLTPLTNTDGTPKFTTAQQFATQLATAMATSLSTVNARYDETTNRLGFHVELANHAFAPQDANFTFGFNFDPLTNLSLTGTANTVHLTTTATTLKFDVEVDLSPFQAVFQGNVDLPANGRLSNAAHFGLSVNGADFVNVLVPDDAGNNARADLVADVNAALASAGLSSVQAVLQGNRLTLLSPTNSEGAVLLIQADRTDPAATQLGLSQTGAPTVAVLQGSAAPAGNGHLSADAVFQLAVNGRAAVAVTVAAAATADNSQAAHLIADLQTALDAANLSDVSAELVDGKIQLRVFRTSGPASLVLSAAAGNPTISELHFAASQSSDQTIGLAAAVDSLQNRINLGNIIADLSVAQSASGLSASGKYGFVDVDISAGSLTGTQTMQFHSTAGQVQTLNNLFADLNAGTNFNAAYTGSGSLALPVSVVNNTISLTGPGPRVQITGSNLFQATPTLTVQTVNAPELDKLRLMSASSLVAALTDVAGALERWLSAAPTNRRLAFVNASPHSLAPLEQPFRDAVNRLSGASITSLRSVVGAIESAFGLPSDAVTMSLVGGSDLQFQFHFQPAGVSGNLPIDLDLATLSTMAGGVSNLSGLKRLIESGTSSAHVDTSADLNLRFGFTLTSDGNPAAYLNDATTVDYSVQVQGSNVTFQANAGALHVFVGNGSVAIGNGAGAANYHVALTQISGDHYAPASVTASQVSVSSTGTATANLPLAYPAPSNALSPALAVTINNLVGTTASVTAPNLSQQATNINLNNDMSALPGAVEDYFSKLQNVLNATVLNANFPLIGQGLNQAVFLKNLGQQISSAIQQKFTATGAKNKAAVDQAGFALFGNDVPPAPSPATIPPGSIYLPFLSIPLVLPATALPPQPLASGIPGLELSAGAIANITVQPTINFAKPFFFNPFTGLGIDVSGANEITLQVTASVAGVALTGKFGDFDATLTDHGSTLSATITMDLGDVDGDFILSGPELPAIAPPLSATDVVTLLTNNPNLIRYTAIQGSASFNTSFKADFFDPQNNLLQSPTFFDPTPWAVTGDGIINQEQFQLSGGTTGVLQQTMNLVDLGRQTSILDSQTLYVRAGGTVASSLALALDDVQVELIFRDANGNSIGAPVSASAAIAAENGEATFIVQADVPVGARQVLFRFTGAAPGSSGLVTFDNAFVYVAHKDALLSGNLVTNWNFAVDVPGAPFPAALQAELTGDEAPTLRTVELTNLQLGAITSHPAIS